MGFSGILGHDRQIGVLRRNIRTGQLPPAYLFQGDEGIGKMLVATRLAMAVNCTAGEDSAPCGHCRACNNVLSGCHPNARTLTLEVNPDTGKLRQEIVIEQVRSAQEFLSLRAVGEGRKVLIVDGAHQMKESAANAFLKTLEEPPDNSHVVLVTSKPGRLLTTILSRCRAVSFSPLSPEIVAGIVAERNGLTEDAARFVARMTGGRVGEALSTDAADLSARRQDVLKTLSALFTKGPSALIKEAEEAAKAEGGLEDFVFFASAWFRDIMVILLGADAGLTYNNDIADELSRWADGFTPDGCEEALRMLSQAGRELERTFNRRLLAEDLFFRLREGAPA